MTLKSIAEKYRPSFVSHLHIISRRETSYTIIDKGKIIIEAPRPSSPEYLFNLLHEYAHALFHQKSACHRYMEEYQATQYAMRIFKKEGLTVSKELDNKNRAYIGECIWRAVLHGLDERKIPEEIFNYANRL